MTLSTVTLSLYYNRYLLAPFIMHIFLYLLQFIIKRYYRYIVLIFSCVLQFDGMRTYIHTPQHTYPDISTPPKKNFYYPDIGESGPDPDAG